METSDLYYNTEVVSPVAARLYDRAKEASEKEWVDYYHFKALPLHEDWALDSWAKDLLARHPFQAGIIRLDPYVFYDWHIDTDRGVGVNMLLNAEGSSHCLFTRTLKRDSCIAHGSGTNNFVELEYASHTYYLFNTQTAHSVYNFKEPRYLFSMDFLEDRHTLSYATLRDELTH